MVTDAGPDRETVYLNNADQDALSRLGMSDEQARALVEARPFLEWGDLKRIDGIDQDRISALKSAGADLGGPSSGPIGEPSSGGSAASPASDIGRA